MKNIQLSFTALLLFFICLTACSKNNSANTINPVTPPVVPPDSTTISLNAYYPESPNFSTGQFELIISTSKGSILIDTVANINTGIALNVRTPEKLVDVTTINYNKNIPQYFVQTFKGVNPSQWDTLSIGFGYNTPILSSAYTQAHLHYINTPAYSGSPYFFTYAGTSSDQYSYSGGNVDVDYQRHSNTYTLLLIPSAGLYKLYNAVSDSDTVDVSKMDTAVQLNFNRPSQYTITSLSLLGIMDTTDYSKTITLYNSLINYTGADIVYPGKSVQQYQLNVYGKNSNNDVVYHFNYGDSVSTAIAFPDESDYTIINNLGNNFTVKFPNTKPTYYQTNWTSGQVNWNLYVSADSTQLNPVGLLNALHSHFLNGIDISNLALSTFSFEQVKYADYPTYMANAFNSKLRTKRLIYLADKFTKTF